MVNNLSQSSSHSTENSGQPPPKFPSGLRVFLVEDDPTDLETMDHMLRQCQYNVTICLWPKVPLDILREKREEFDIVLCGVRKLDKDGFELLESIKLEMSIPVIMMSVAYENDLVLKVFDCGACDYLIKPVSLEALKTIWRHVIKKKSNELRSMSVEISDKQKNLLEDVDNTTSENEGNWTIVKREREREEEDEFEEQESLCYVKKPRVVWTTELHNKFVVVVEQLGAEKAVPKKILELMNEPNLTRENVASHLQKYRLHLKKSNAPQHQGRTDVAFSTIRGASFNSVNSLDGYGLKALTTSGQLPPQAIMNLSRLAASNCIDSSIATQRVLFNSEAQLTDSSNTRPTMVQQVNINQMNLLAPPMFQPYGNISHQAGAQGLLSFPSSLRTSSSFSDDSINESTNPFIMQMNQRGRLISLESNMEQLPNRVLSELDSRFNYSYTPRPLHVTSAARGLQALDDITNLRGMKDAIANYDDMFFYCDNKNQDLKLKNINLSYASSQHVVPKPINIDYGSSVSIDQDFNATLKDEVARDTCTIRKERPSIRAEIETEEVEHACQDILFYDDIFQDDLMSVIRRQPEEAIGQMEPENNLESFSHPELNSIRSKGVEHVLQSTNNNALSIPKGNPLAKI